MPKSKNNRFTYYQIIEHLTNSKDTIEYPLSNGAVVQLVRILACHASGRGFEPRSLRNISA